MAIVASQDLPFRAAYSSLPRSSEAVGHSSRKRVRLRLFRRAAACVFSVILFTGKREWQLSQSDRGRWNIKSRPPKLIKACSSRKDDLQRTLSRHQAVSTSHPNLVETISATQEARTSKCNSWTPIKTQRHTGVPWSGTGKLPAFSKLSLYPQTVVKGAAYPRRK